MTRLLYKTFISRHCFPKPLLCSTTAGVESLTKVACIQHLKYCKSMRELKQIQTQVFRKCLHQSNEVLNKLVAFCIDPSIGNVSYAERIFGHTEVPNLFIYNVMIKAYTKSGKFREAIMLFDDLRADRLLPDNFTYPFVFKAIAGLRDILQGKKIHGFVVKSGIDFDCYVCNSIMNMYAQVGTIESSKRMFDEMPDRDLVTWNVLISGYVRCRRFKDAIMAYRQLREEDSVRPDEATVVSTLSACTALKNSELGKGIHQYICNELEFTPIICNALLDMHSKCGNLSVARQIFDAMPTKNVICWTSMVSGYANCGQLNEARELFERSTVKDIVLWTAMLNGYVQFNQVDKAMALFRKMQKERVKPDKFILVALLTGCAQVGALEQGKWIHEYMQENRMKIDAISGTALIDMYAKCGCIEKSLEIFSELKERDTAVWTSIVCGLAINGKTSKALEFFSEMKRAGFRPDDITFIGVLSACSHGGLVEEGKQYFRTMTEIYQIVPKLEHYGCLIDLLGRAGLLKEAEEWIERLPSENNKIIIPLYGALLSACRVYSNIDMGERVARRLEENESSDSSVHTLMAYIYASADRWEDVTKVRRKMKALGVTKAPGCSSIDVNGRIHEFLARDTSHPEMSGIYSMLNSMAKPLLALEESGMEQEKGDLMI